MTKSDLSISIRYRINQELELTCQMFITWISQNCPEILLLQQGNYDGGIKKTILLKLIHRQWGAVAGIELYQNGLPHTTLSLHMPPDPTPEESGTYEDRLLEAHPEEVWSLRLALVDGQTDKAMELMRSALRTQRVTYFDQIHCRIMRAFPLELAENDSNESGRDIPDGDGQSPAKIITPTQVDEQLLNLWANGYTARQIALHTHRTEKTILNRLSLLRKAYGEQSVPRRKTV